jgi:hypothetical protein
MSRLLSNIQKAPFLFLEDHPDQFYEQINETMEQGYNELRNMNVDVDEVIKDTFYSARNIDLIQKWLIKEIALKKNIKIRYQKVEHLLNIMAGIYETYCQNLPFSLKEQIYELDRKVVEFCIPIILDEIIGNNKYLEKLNTANYIDQPLCVNSKGQRQLPSAYSSRD